METAETSKCRLWLAAILLAAAGAVFMFGVWLAARKPDAPPSVLVDRTAPVSRQPEVLGSAKCGECHAEQFADYQSSGHAKTLWSTRDFPFRDRFDGLKFTDEERQETYHYVVDDSGVDVVVPGKFGGDRFPLQFAFGSGQHAITFVSLTPDGSDVPTGIEHRVSWFTGYDAAGLTPGQLGRTVRHEIECFGRIIHGTTLERCFECHSTSGRIEGDQVVGLIPNVGCESCHGGGAVHAARMQDATAPRSRSVHGFEQRPWRTAEQIQICARCHRGEDTVDASTITRQNPKIVRFQPVGLVQSKCYIKSGRQLTCSSCHDPHQHASRQTPEQYEQKCLQCHSLSPSHVRCSVSPETDCVSCHMPRVEVHPSISFHDHWIRVRSDADPPAVQGEADASK